MIKYTIVGLDEDGNEIEVLCSGANDVEALEEFHERTNLINPKIKSIEE